MAFNTGNPVPSNKAEDLSDNAENLDSAVNSTGATWTDRLGVTRQTVIGATNSIDAASTQGLIDIAQDVSDVEASADAFDALALDRVNKIGVIYDSPIRDWSASLLVDDLRAHRYPATTGDIYIPKKALPFTTGATFEPADWNLLQGITDADIINDLSQTYTFDTVAEYKASTIVFPVGKAVKTNAYKSGNSNGGSNYLIKTLAQSVADGDVIDESVNYTLADGKVSIFQPKDGTILLEQGGVIIDGVTSNSGLSIKKVFQYAVSKRLGKISSNGGILMLSSTLDLESVLGIDSFVQKWDGYGLTINPINLFADDIMIRVGGSELPNFSTGRNFEIDGLSMDGLTVRPLHAIFNRRGQEFKYHNLRIVNMQNALTFESVFYGSVSGTYSWFEGNDVTVNFQGTEQVSNMGFSDIKFNGVGATLPTAILLNQLAAGLNFSNCTFENFKHVMNTTTATNHAGITRKCTFERCYFESNDDVMFQFTNGITSNAPKGFTIKDCYFNDGDIVLIESFGGGFTVKDNNIDLEIKARLGGARLTLHTDQNIPVTYVGFSEGLPEDGAYSSQKINAWDAADSNADWQSYNTIGDTNVYPSRNNSLPSFADRDKDHILTTFANSKSSKSVQAKVGSVKTMQHKDVNFIDSTKGVVLRDRANRNDFYRLYMVDGVFSQEKVFNNKALAPRSDARMARALYQELKHGVAPTMNDLAYSDELNIQLLFDGANWTLGEGQSAGQVGIGTFLDLNGGSNYPGFDRPVYNVDVDEVWGTIGGSTNFREIGTSKAKNGATGSRPSGVPKGYIFYDETVVGYVFWDGSSWQTYTHKLPWVI